MAFEPGQNLRGGRLHDADGRQVVVASGGASDTAAASSSVTSPAAGAVLASLAGLAAGVYDVEVTVLLTATAETALRNVNLRSNGVEVAQLNSLTGQVLRYRFPRFRHTGGNIDMTAVAVGVVGAVYNTAITATRAE